MSQRIVLEVVREHTHDDGEESRVSLSKSNESINRPGEKIKSKLTGTE
jgi:hypothetical protein